MITIATLRMMERLLAVITGGFSIYLGYRLFVSIPSQANGEGKFALPGGISIYLTRVGPGVFFALFGAIVVALSFHYSIKIDSDSTGHVKTMSGLAPIKANDQQKLDTERLTLRMDIFDSLPSLMNAKIPEEDDIDLAELVKNIKIALMKGVWGPDWGDFDEFIICVENRAQYPSIDDLSKEVMKAAKYYSQEGP